MCVRPYRSDHGRQKQRWMYCVKEYLQPIQSENAHRTITIIAAHGNLLSSFDHIITNYLHRNTHGETFADLRLPYSTTMMHAQVTLYHSIGTKPLRVERTYHMAQIPVTINHAMLSADLNFRWASEFRCRVSNIPNFRLDRSLSVISSSARLVDCSPKMDAR